MFSASPCTGKFARGNCHPISTHGNARALSLLSAKSTTSVSQGLPKHRIGSCSRSAASSRAPPSSAQSVPARRAVACTHSRSRFSSTHDDHRDRQDPHEGGRSNPHCDLSQSERDWAFAKRALARGDDPEEVIRRIADYRGDEKHANYARHTVEKAKFGLDSAATK